MIINSFDKMESIVKCNSNLKWDNWTVIAIDNSDGYYTKDGAFIDGEWKKQYRFDMVDYGVWNIPDRYLTHVQV